jgi:hypothetical protein
VASGPGGISSAWNAFFHDWVKPVVHFGTPVLIVFAVLLTLTRVLTGVLVTKDAPGVRSAKTSARLPVSVMYWFGVTCLLYAAIEATVIFPLARTVMWGKHQPSAPPAPLTAEFSIAMVAAAGVVVWVLYRIIGRPFKRKVYAPGLKKRQRRDLGLVAYARIWWTVPVTVVMALGAAAFILPVIGIAIGTGHWHIPRLDGRVMPGAYAPLLAVLGVVIVGRARGIGMGLVIQGHDKTGGDDAGLAASVRARLYTLASHGPVGIQVTQQTDVSTLPQEALNLIPDGTLAKLAALFMSLFSPATPWRADITEQSDGSIVVSILRNGVSADAVVVRSSTLWLPDQSTNNAGTASIADDVGQAAGASSNGSGPASPSTAASGSGPAGPGTAADWTVELRTAAAAFILLTLSKRYYHLQAGLSGAKDWRSVAMQVIATDQACHLSGDDKRALLANAVAEDDGNMAAQLAFLNASYRTTADQIENRLFAESLFRLLEKVPNEEGMWPLRLRLRFNLLACLLNEAASLLNEAALTHRPEDPQNPDGSVIAQNAERARLVLEAAAEQAGHLVIFWQNPENQRALPELWEDMDAAVTIAAKAVKMAWERRFNCALKVSWKENRPDDVLKRPKMTLVARYEHACTLVGYAAISTGRRQSSIYSQALDELEMVTAVQEHRTWARTDPSLAELHDVDRIKSVLRSPAATDGGSKIIMVPSLSATVNALAAEYASGPLLSDCDIASRFKTLTGDPCPVDFLALPPFARRRAEIEDRGIHSAADLSRKAAELDGKSAEGVVSGLGITGDVATRWLNVTDLYTWLRDLPPASKAKDTAKQDKITTALVFLLLRAEVDSLPALRRELRKGLDQFRERLLDCARPWAVVVPGIDDIRCWLETYETLLKSAPESMRRMLQASRL